MCAGVLMQATEAAGGEPYPLARADHNDVVTSRLLFQATLVELQAALGNTGRFTVCCCSTQASMKPPTALVCHAQLLCVFLGLMYHHTPVAPPTHFSPPHQSSPSAAMPRTSMQAYHACLRQQQHPHPPPAPAAAGALPAGLDLHMLYSSVTRLGGFQQVDQRRQWTDMAAAAAANGPAALAAAAHALRQLPVGV